MFWFDGDSPEVLCGDRRAGEYTLCDGRTLKVEPDRIMDFRDLPFADKTFQLVVFDPPHLKRGGDSAWMVKKYGRLDPETWQGDLTAGFNECWRAPRPGGTLIFKWNETQIPIREVLACFPRHPLFGHTTTQNLKTHWMTFYQPDSPE